MSLLLLAILSLTPLWWFKDKGEVLINGIDTNFPLNPLMWFFRRMFIWTDFPNAGTDFSSSTAGLFFHLIQVIPYQLGFSLQHVQIISLVFWFGLIIFASFILARVLFPKAFFIQLLFVTLYSFNIYLFNTWENIKVANLSLIASIPLALTILVLLEQKTLSKPRALLLASLIGLVLSGSGINPSYFVCFILIMLLFSLSWLIANFNFLTLKKVLINFLIVTLPIFLINIFWILPTAIFISTNISPQGSLDEIGFTNWIDSLSENTSLVNVMRLQGAWDWYAVDGITGLPIYIPYALNYFFRFPFILFSFLLPGFAILSLVWWRKGEKLLYIAFSLMFVLGVFLGAGTHEPTGLLFRWLSDHLPFFTIFRSPWYIFTPLVTLSTAGLISLFFYRFWGGKSKIFKLAVQLLIIVLILGNLVYSYPLLTGKIFRPGRADSFFVNFPDYVFQAKDWLDKQKTGRIIGYPDDEIEKFSWGYRGIESILGLMSAQEVFFNPLNAPDSNIAILVKQFYSSLKKGQFLAAESLAQKLNIGLIFEKGDQESLAPGLANEVKKNQAASFGAWNFYKFPEQTTPKIYSPKSIFLGPIQKEGVRIIGVLPGDSVLLNGQDTVVKSIDALKNYRGLILLAKNSQEEELKSLAYTASKLEKRLVTRDLSRVEFVVDIPQEGNYSPIMERYALEKFGIFVDQKMEVEIDGQRILLEPESSSDSYLQFKRINLSSGEHKISIKLKNENLVSGGDFNSGATFDKGGYGEGRGEYTISEDINGKFLQIFNVGKANVSADFSISQFDPYLSYYIELKYKQIYGNNGTAVVLQGNDRTLVKAQTERLPNYPEWNRFSFYYEPVQTNSRMKMTLESPYTSDPLGTKILYDDLVVLPVFTNNLLFLKEGENNFVTNPKIEFTQKSPVNYEGKVSGANGPHLIVFSENYSPEWELTGFDKSGRLIKRNYHHFSSNIYANAWYIDTDLENYNFKIYYRSQRLFWTGTVISGMSILIFALAYFYLSFNRRSYNERK